MVVLPIAEDGIGVRDHISSLFAFPDRRLAGLCHISVKSKPGSNTRPACLHRIFVVSLA